MKNEEDKQRLNESRDKTKNIAKENYEGYKE